jgi:hypothetical protein
VLSDAVMLCGDIGVTSKINEWNLLKRQFDALGRDDSSGPDRIELDADFHRRFAELMNRVCGPSQYYQKANPFPHSSDVGTHGRFNH